MNDSCLVANKEHCRVPIASAIRTIILGLMGGLHGFTCLKDCTLRHVMYRISAVTDQSGNATTEEYVRYFLLISRH